MQRRECLNICAQFPNALRIFKMFICPCSLRESVVYKGVGWNPSKGKNYNLSKGREKHMYQDKTLKCKECGNEFVFTAGEQEFYAARGFENEPSRCKDCRAARKNAQKGAREMFAAVCGECGKECQVPFKPTEGKAVYCSECFAAKRAEQA